MAMVNQRTLSTINLVDYCHFHDQPYKAISLKYLYDLPRANGWKPFIIYYFHISVNIYLLDISMY
jgi:hypothetical protein